MSDEGTVQATELNCVRRLRGNALIKRFLFLLKFLLLAFCCVACTAQQMSSKEICPATMEIEKGGRRVCLNAKKWTGDYIPTDIRPLFVEAPGEVEIKMTKPRPWHDQSAPYWVDNERIMVSVNSYKGWTAGVDELSKVLIFNVDTGDVEETPYRGHVRCLSPEGALLLEEKPSRSSKSRKYGDTSPREEYFLKGQLGETLARYSVIYPSKEKWGINEYTCRHVNDSGDEIPPGRFLRKGDGFIAWPDPFHREYLNRLLDENWKVVDVFKEVGLCNTLYTPDYLPWLNKYFAFTSVGNTQGGYCPGGSKYGWLISATGVETKELPALFQAAATFGHGLVGNGRNYWARRGQYISTGYIQERPNLLAGLYWQDEKTGLTKRVLKQDFRLDHLSPNGCRSFNDDVILELCTKGD